MTDTPRILSFAGQHVPDDGLAVATPQGWTLTVWPDGRYDLTPPADASADTDRAPVKTYYPFVMEDVDGSESAGTFSLEPGDMLSGAIEGFQGWSLSELLDEADVSLHLLGDAPGNHADAAASQALPVEPHVELMGADGFDDDLTQLIIHSQHS